MSLEVEIEPNSQFALFQMHVHDGKSYLLPFVFPGERKQINPEVAAFTKVPHQESTDDTGLVGVDGSRFAIPAEEAFGCGYEAPIYSTSRALASEVVEMLGMRGIITAAAPINSACCCFFESIGSPSVTAIIFG
ncbi:MAG: hypothetical protein US39_C0024G0004 [Microgenomates group bacterium GW2011_GWC1_37_12b]|nr:MAG: hypothetical protein US39_C0024G0004 [Microgenomates group bacterium GW2011_GWC1_37_12b]